MSMSSKKALELLPSLKKRVIEVTSSFLPKKGSANAAEMGPLGESVAAIISTIEGDRSQLATVFSAILGEPVVYNGSQLSGFVPYLAVVPLSNPNSHDYPTGRASVVYSGSSAIRPNLSGGNNLPKNKGDESSPDGRMCIRAATLSEVEDLFTTFEERLMQGNTPDDRMESLLKSASK